MDTSALRPDRLAPRLSIRWLAALVIIAATLAGAPVQAQEAAAPSATDGPAFTISRFELRYLREDPLHPPLDELLDIPVTLGIVVTGYVAPRDELETVTSTIRELNTKTADYHASAIQRVLEVLRDELIVRDLLGVYVAPDPSQISATGRDVRESGDTVFRIIITTGIVSEMRTTASGDRVRERGRITPETRIDNPLHARILDRSPIQPYDESAAAAQEEPEPRSDLLRKSVLDDYLFHLSRHPGRRVDASVAAAIEVGAIDLDYMVTENRPLVFYAQVSNTGTPQTDRIRERFGFFHTQLTNNDDGLSVDYLTANFDQVNAINASYDRPFANDRIRWKVYGGWNEYSASDLGFAQLQFESKTALVGGEIVANFYQKRELFLDVVGGVRYENIKTENPTFQITGEQDFVLPYIGLRLERTTAWYATRGQATFEFQDGSITDVSRSELIRLGRTNPSEDWVVLRWGFGHSFFLEPFLDRAAWEDPTTPESSTLAHEMRFTFSGQYAFDDRLIPQEEGVLGGLYTVRGYPESVVAGDTTLVGSIEYRYHVPRAFKIRAEPNQLFGEAFRTAPQYVYGQPDWDLILKGFFDIGRAMISEKTFFEQDETLIGIGIGVDFVYRRDFNVRLDWGFALDAIESRDVNSGSNRLYVVATFTF